MNTKEKLKSFRELLYPNNEEAEELNDVQVKKVIYEGLREFLKRKEYQFTVGSYYFDVTPKNLSVIYETPDTRIEVSNKDVHFETTRQLPIRYYAISPEAKEEYPDDQAVIQVSGEILQYDNYYNSETYTFVIMGNTNDEVKKYIQVPEGCEMTEDDFEFNPTEVAIYREINRNSKVTDVSIFFNTDLKPVEYDYLNKKYIPKTFDFGDNYNMYLPVLDKKKKMISTIYSTIVDFYNEYMNK